MHYYNVDQNKIRSKGQIILTLGLNNVSNDQLDLLGWYEVTHPLENPVTALSLGEPITWKTPVNSQAYNPSLMADNPADVERFNTIKAALEAYPGDKVQFRQQLVATIAPALTTQEAAVVAQLLR